MPGHPAHASHLAKGDSSQGGMRCRPLAILSRGTGLIGKTQIIEKFHFSSSSSLRPEPFANVEESSKVTSFTPLALCSQPPVPRPTGRAHRGVAGRGGKAGGGRRGAS